MEVLNNYLAAQQAAPAQPDFLQMIAQANMVPPDQAQLMSQGVATPPPVDVPMVDTFKPGQGLAAYMPAATKAMDRSLIDQYTKQSQESLGSQQSGIGQMEKYARDLAAKPNNVDFTGLAGLADVLNEQMGHKTDLRQTALAARGMTPDEKNDKLLKLQEYIQTAKGGMSKENLQATQQMLQMIHQNDMTNLTAQHYDTMERALNVKTDMSGNRIQSTQEMAAQRQFLGDSVNKSYIPRLDGAIKVMDFIDGAEKGAYKTNKAFLGQMNAEILRLETGSQSPGLGQGEKTEMTSQAAALKDVYDSIAGGVTGVDLSKKIEQARGMVGNLGQSYRQQIESRNRVIAAGATKAQQPIFAAKADQFGKDLDSRISQLSPASAAALGSKSQAPGKVKVSNGKESFMIDPGHIGDAKRDGYEVVK